jgi:predicted nucleic acid-binding protein
MGQYLMDSNVLIDYTMNRIPQENVVFLERLIQEDFVLSVIIKIEVLGYKDTPEKMEMMEKLVARAELIPLDEAIIQGAIDLRRNYKLKLGDAIIAATALKRKLTLITHNMADFKKIDGLPILNPYDSLTNLDDI